VGSIFQVTPESDRYDLVWQEHEIWIEVKRLLTVREARKQQFAGITGMQMPTRDDADKQMMGLDGEAMSFARTMAYLVDWSLTDENDNKIKINVDTVGAMPESLYDAIDEVIGTHVAKREQEKKVSPRRSPKKRKLSSAS